MIELPGIVLSGKRRYRQIFALYAEHNLPFADAYYAVLMEQLKLTEILSFDRDFDRSPGSFILRTDGPSLSDRSSLFGGMAAVQHVSVVVSSR